MSLITAKFTGTNDKQVQWVGNDDPRKCLVEGQHYSVKTLEVHSYHTKVHLYAFPGKKFNSASFEFTPEDAVEKACTEWLVGDKVNPVG